MERIRLCGVCKRAPQVDGLRRCSRVVASSEALRNVLAKCAVVAQTKSSAVIHGETGTGKEVIARLIHSNSPRHSRPFLAVNVAALPSELLESELFGHAKGAFTGAAASTPGLFGEADGGTLLLDEIGEMPLLLQAKLLRVLQEGEIRRVGEARARPVDVRVLSATHRDLKALVAAGRFREDLFYRLRVFTLNVPPLRERRDDIVPLARMFASKLGVADLKLSARARAMLEAYTWPGNVRELGNAIEHAVAFAQDRAVAVEHLPEDIAVSPPRPSAADGELKSLDAVERAHIARVLDSCDNNQERAARVLGISRSTLWRKIANRRATVV
ncbi:MAG: sigma 54-interacting transcriptional regulator [Deltaproteobacteria bacterium]|nr:sigma 54-interacting transcriptional regulator [Deltaproteobacteria bacterium]